MAKNPTPAARAVAERCDTAYSYDRYRSWPAVAQVLLDHGLTELEAEAVMRSKWMRWAADRCATNKHRYGQYPASFITAILPQLTPKEVEQITVGTFPDRAADYLLSKRPEPVQPKDATINGLTLDQRTHLLHLANAFKVFPEELTGIRIDRPCVGKGDTTVSWDEVMQRVADELLRNH